MSLISIPPARHPQRFRWSGDEFDLASEMGVFGNKRVELVEGDLLEMPPMNDPHAQAVQLANYALLPIFTPDRMTSRIQSPMRLGESRPLPDLVVVSGTPRQVVKHPTTALLVIEVSDTTLEYDQTTKAALYATHALPEYWIININARCLEVRRNPSRRAGTDAEYADRRVYAGPEAVAPLAAQHSIIRVADLLP